MDSGLVTALQGVAPVKCSLVRIGLAGGNVCLTDGGFAVFDAGDGPELYESEHPTIGVLSSIGSIADGAEATTTRIDLVILPRDDAAAAALGSPLAQGARVQWWEGVIDPGSGGLAGVPLLKFDGEIDKPVFSVGGSWALTLQCGTQAERQLEPNADWRLNHAFHSRVWPGEGGLIHVTNLPQKLYWRQSSPNGAWVTR
jgi:hypothetical protein